MTLPVLGELTVGESGTFRFDVTDEEGTPVRPTACTVYAARWIEADKRFDTPTLLTVDLSLDGNTATFEPSAAGPWTIKATVSSPVKVIAEAVVRVSDPAF